MKISWWNYAFLGGHRHYRYGAKNRNDFSIGGTCIQLQKCQCPGPGHVPAVFLGTLTPRPILGLSRARVRQRSSILWVEIQLLKNEVEEGVANSNPSDSKKGQGCAHCGKSVNCEVSNEAMSCAYSPRGRGGPGPTISLGFFS